MKVRQILAAMVLTLSMLLVRPTAESCYAQATAPAVKIIDPIPSIGDPTTAPGC